MKKISDFNSATEKYPVIYAGSATRPEYVDMPTILQQQEGVAPMATLPAQWWNAMWKLATRDINAFRDYVGDSITEINNLLTKFGITLDDADSEQLYDFFHDDYVQNYLNGIFVNKSGDTINGDLHVKGDLTVDGIGEEIISTELKVGANTITLRNDNPTALGNTELAGVVTENYDGNNNNNIIAIDKNGVARVGDIDIATRILYSNNGTNFFTDEDMTIPATIGTDEKVRDTGNQTSGGVKIYEGVTYSNDDTQAIATREDTPVDGALMKWDAATKKLVSATGIGAPVGTLISQYKKVPMSGYLYCDGSTFDETAYPALYLYLGSNVLPDYRECVMVGAEQNTTDTIATHDVYTQGEFKDDQMQIISGSVNPWGYKGALSPDGCFGQDGETSPTYTAVEAAQGSRITFNSSNVVRADATTDVTHGKQKAVYVYIKATSGLAENQQENVLNAINENNTYSTAETTTGYTWIDGKPIYRKVVEVANLPNNTQTSYSHGIVNADSFVTIRGIAKSTTLSLPIPYVERNGATNIQISAQAVSFDISTNYDASSYAGTIIFEYTKTTD